MPPFANLFRSRKRFNNQENRKVNTPESPVAESPTYVTRDEFDALTRVVGVALARVDLAHARSGYPDGTVGAQLAAAERSPNLPAPERSVLKRLMKAFGTTMDQYHALERQRATERGNAYHRIHG